MPLKVLFYLARDLVGIDVGLEPADHIAFPVHQELGEIPLDAVVAEELAELRLEPRLESLALKALKAQEGLFAAKVVVQRMSCLSPDVDLLEHLERYVVIAGAEALDLLVGAGLLTAELVAGESQYFKALRFVLFIETFQALILSREPSLAGYVHDQKDLAFIVFKGLFNAVYGIGFKVVDGHAASFRLSKYLIIDFDLL